MIEFVTDKSRITEAVMNLIKDKHPDLTVERAKKLFWQNIRDTGGLGLSYDGYMAFKIAELESWEFPVSAVTKHGTLSLMSYAVIIDRKLPCPWYITVTRKEKFITVYDSRVATMIMLHGDFGQYLETLENLYESNS